MGVDPRPASFTDRSEIKAHKGLLIILVFTEMKELFKGKLYKKRKEKTTGATKTNIMKQLELRLNAE